MKGPAAALPSWTPRSKREREWFIEWTIEQWHDEFEGPPTEEDIWRENEMATNPQVQQELARGVPGFIIFNLVFRNDEEGFVRLMRDPHFARHEFQIRRQQLRQQTEPKSGRPKKPIGQVEKHFLDWPSEVVNQIYYIWKKHFGKWERKKDDPPSVYEIAVRIVRQGIMAMEPDEVSRNWLDANLTADALVQYRRKHGRP
jgi:hypothetical protein